MSAQRLLEFDPEKGDKLKKRGMDAAAARRHAILDHARAVARNIALRRGCPISADDVYIHLIGEGHKATDLGPAAGKIFLDGNWVFTGQYVKSTRVSNHGRDIKVWRLK